VRRRSEDALKRRVDVHSAGTTTRTMNADEQ